MQCYMQDKASGKITKQVFKLNLLMFPLFPVIADDIYNSHPD